MHLSELEAAPFSRYDAGSELRDHILRRSRACFAAGDAARDAIRTVGALRRRQSAIREFFLESIGGLPSPDSPLNARTTGTLEAGDYRIEKVIFESRPGTPVTANLYLPRELRGRSAAVLFLCGHEREAKHCAEYQAVCQILARAGLIVLAQDPIGQGERCSYHEPEAGRETIRWGIHEHDHAGAQALLLGDGIARYFLHDAMRGIDYLRSRSEVDPRRIGVTGNSGGGTQTSMMMMADKRIAAAAPGTFIMNRESFLQTGHAQDAEQIWLGFTGAGYDHEDILLAMAPRPVCVLAATWDSFPIEGTRRTVARTRRFWKMCGAASAFQFFEDCAEHHYTVLMARAAAAFFSRHLNGASGETRHLEGQPVAPESLWCTRSGHVRAEKKQPRAVYEENCHRLRVLGKQRPSCAKAKEWLRERIFHGRAAGPLEPCRYAQEFMQELDVELWHWNSQPGLKNSGYLFRHFQFRGQALPVTIAIWEGGTRQLRAHADLLQHVCGQCRAVLVLNMSGAGPLRPHPMTSGGVSDEDFYGAMHVLSDNLLWLGDSLAALRAYDVLRVVEVLGQIPGVHAEDTKLYLHGRETWPARLAALVEPRIAKVEEHDSPTCTHLLRSRHYQSRGVKSVILPGILKYWDL